ncbi:MAG TPA: head GIN domain-containing protein [Ktedonobacterales bacterium]
MPRRNRSKTARPVALALMALALSVGVLLSSCVTSIGGTVGSGTAKTETRNVSGFTGVTFSGVGTLNITQTGTESLTVSADDNLLPLLTSTVTNDTLTLGVKPGNAIHPTKPIVYTLTVKSLNNMTLSGAGTINATNVTTNALHVILSGAGAIKATNITASALNVALSGAGSMTISGRAPSQTAVVSGIGAYNARNFPTDSAQMTISGAGSATITVNKTLTAVVSGAGSVTYYGSPSQVTKTISGSGSIKQGS